MAASNEKRSVAEGYGILIQGRTRHHDLAVDSHDRPLRGNVSLVLFSDLD